MKAVLHERFVDEVQLVLAAEPVNEIQIVHRGEIFVEAPHAFDAVATDQERVDKEG